MYMLENKYMEWRRTGNTNGIKHQQNRHMCNIRNKRTEKGTTNYPDYSFIDSGKEKRRGWNTNKNTYMKLKSSSRILKVAIQHKEEIFNTISVYQISLNQETQKRVMMLYKTT